MRQEVCEHFKELQKQYHNVIQDAPLITKIKAFITYGCMSLNLFWKNTDNKEKFIIVSRIIDEIIYNTNIDHYFYCISFIIFVN